MQSKQDARFTYKAMMTCYDQIVENWCGAAINRCDNISWQVILFPSGDPAGWQCLYPGKPPISFMQIETCVFGSWKIAEAALLAAGAVKL